jgi:transposase
MTGIFFEAVLWKLRSGAPWRDLPSEFPPYSSIFNRFNRWSKIGLWKEIFEAMRSDLDNEWNFIDATIVKSHQHALGYSSHNSECIGKSVAGNSTKIHMLSDSHGNPIEFVISEGQIHDSQVAEQLIELSNGENIIADKAYDSEKIRKTIADKGLQAIIPKKSNAIDKTNVGYDKYLYKIRHLAENLFARLKHFRSIATRYEKKTINFHL